MRSNSLVKIKRKFFIIFPLSFLFIIGLLLLTAGSLEYWWGWLYSLVIFVPAFFVALYFLKTSPELLERRMKYKEKEVKQKKIIGYGNICFLLVFITPALDYRFGWSNVPLWLVLISNVIVLVGYFLIFLSFKENSFAGRTIEVFKEQSVISTGPYSIVRHPMYAGVLPMFMFTSLALGSYWGLIFVIPIIVIIVLRAINEEELLKIDLPGYDEYCKKVKYHIIPFIW